MKTLANLFKLLILIAGIVILSFNALLYNSFEQQRNEINAINDQQKVDAQLASNKFKDQQAQIERLSHDLADAQQQVKSQDDDLSQQKDALLQEVQKRQQVESDSKYIQTSLVDIKAEADAIKQDMKGWQKDYVSVLAQLEKKIDDSQDEIKSLDTNLTALNIPQLKEDIGSLKSDVENMAHPSSSSFAPETLPPPAADQKNDSSSSVSQ